MIHITDKDASTNFGTILDRVAEGEEVTVTRAGQPVARIVKIGRKKKPSPEELQAVFAEMDEIRQRTTLDGLSVKDLIEEGRRY